MATKPRTPTASSDAPRKKRASVKTATANESMDTVNNSADVASVVTVKKGSSRGKRVAPAIQAEERHHLIEVAAYYIAERRGFHGESSHDDWLLAEQEIDVMIAQGRFAG